MWKDKCTLSEIIQMTVIKTGDYVIGDFEGLVFDFITVEA